MFRGKVFAGEVWEIDGRRGPLTVKLLESIEASSDDFFSAEIISGAARFISQGNQMEQRACGKGTAGDTMTFRASLTTFKRIVEKSTLPEALAVYAKEASARGDGPKAEVVIAPGGVTKVVAPSKAAKPAPAKRKAVTKPTAKKPVAKKAVKLKAKSRPKLAAKKTKAKIAKRKAA